MRETLFGKPIVVTDAPAIGTAVFGDFSSYMREVFICACPVCKAYCEIPVTGKSGMINGFCVNGHTSQFRVECEEVK